MTGVSTERQAFAYFLRTGRRLPLEAFAPLAPIERKFNPWHDPRNGRFTFAPYGMRAADLRPKPAKVRARSLLERRLDEAEGRAGVRSPGILGNGAFRPGEMPELYRPIAGSLRRPGGIGDNSRGLIEPLTLQRAFPGLVEAPGGSVIALADGVFGFTAPGQAAVETLYQAQRRALIADIAKFRPGFEHAELQPPQSIEAKLRVLNELRARRAADIYLRTGKLHDLQVETLRVMQEATDVAYPKGLRRQALGTLPISPTDRMALGNYIDREVREKLRAWYGALGISLKDNAPVRVNSRDYIEATDGAYVRPDARLGRLAFDVTLTEKGLHTRQVRDFFNAERGTDAVAIIRPRAEDSRGIYIIKTPRGK